MLTVGVDPEEHVDNLLVGKTSLAFIEKMFEVLFKV